MLKMQNRLLAEYLLTFHNEYMYKNIHAILCGCLKTFQNNIWGNIDIFIDVQSFTFL